MMNFKASETATVFVFGDATEPWAQDLRQLYKQSQSIPWLKEFLHRLSDVVNSEIQTAVLDQTLQTGLSHFSSLQELGERYADNDDELGVAQALLLHTVRAGNLLQWVKREPQLIGPNARTAWLGISGGLLTVSALAVAQNFEELYDACLETARLVFRVAKLASVRSRAVEDQAGNWGWAVLGIAPPDLANALDHFQQNAGIPSTKRAKVGVTGPGWSTVIGPPSVLKLIMNQCSAVKRLAKNPLPIKALQHTLTTSTAEIDAMVGRQTTFLDRPLADPSRRIWGMDNPAAHYSSWRDLLQAICAQVLSRPLDIVQVVDRLATEFDENPAARIIEVGSCSHATYLASVLKAASIEVSNEDAQAHMRAAHEKPSVPSGRIAIVGMAGRGPKSDNVDEFWNAIMSRQDLCTEIPKDRFDIDDFYCPAHERGDQKCKMTTRYGCFMDNPGHFDSRFFHISPREAVLMDPNHRQFLMSTYEALESAGYSDGPTRVTDPNRIASFYAQATDDWHKQTHPQLGCDSYTLQGIQRAFGAGRLAWQFKWEGPTYSLDSACAGTTAAIHLACMSLLSNDIDMAVAGAANILNWPHSFTCLSDSGILSDTGNCKPFRDDADGYARADFVGAVVLKRLEDAIQHNDNILAVVAGSGRNHSGNSTSITTSDAGAQERLFHKVMRQAQASPSDVSYVEMHGTGTQTGDPAEMGAVANTFKRRHRSLGPLPIGGVKANFGHSEAAAGMAELLKCIMMFRHDIIPPQVHMPHALNPKLPALSEVNIEIPSEPKAFNRPTDSSQPRRILLNNFDAAGGNACLLLEDYVPTPEDQTRAIDPRLTHVIATTSRTKASFEANKARLLQWLRANPDVQLQDVAYTTTARRMHHPLKFACSVSSVDELIRKLEASDDVPSSGSSPDLVFVFTGQGSHYAGMGADLYHSSPVFHDTVDLCVSICDSNGFPPFVEIITNADTDVATKDSIQIQLATVTLEIALASFWRSIGIRPQMVMGHSLGEYVALHVAGVLSLADTLYLVGQRALLLGQRCELGAYGMLAVSLPEQAVRDSLKQLQSHSCDVACINGPKSTVVSGTTDDLARLQAHLAKQDAATRTTLLSMPYAFHSYQMDPILEDYANLAGGVTYSAPKIPIASTNLGAIIDSSGVVTQDYLIDQTRQAVDFVGALRAIQSKLTDPVWLEIGPSPVCGPFVRATLAPAPSKIIHSIERNRDDWTCISRSLVAAYTNHVAVDWLAFHKPYENNLSLLTLPTYAWDMKNYWITWTEPDTTTIGQEEQAKLPSSPFVATCAQYLISASTTPELKLTFRASISDPAFLALIDGHRMQQIGLASGSVFCDAALTAAKQALELSGRKDVTARSLTLHDPVLLLPLTRSLVGVDGHLQTTAVIKDASPASVSISFEAKSSAGASHDLGSMRVEMTDPDIAQARWNRTSYFIKSTADERVKSSRAGAGHIMQPEVVYALFANAVEFDPAFKGIQEAYIAKDFQEAAAYVSLQQNPVGSTFTFSPYWGEALAHLAGFMVNGNPNKPANTTFIVMGFESIEQTIDFEPQKQYLTYTRINRWEKDTAFCDAYVFDAESSVLVMQCTNLRYQELPKRVWRSILEGAHTSKKQSGPQTGKQHPAVTEKQVAGTASAETTQASNEPTSETQAGGASSTPVFDLILESIAKSTGVEASEFTDNAQVAHLGVDSIMAIEVASAVNSQVDIDLPATFVFDYPTVGDLRKEFGAPTPAPAPALEMSVKKSVLASPTTPSTDSEASSLNLEAVNEDVVQAKDLSKEVIRARESSQDTTTTTPTTTPATSPAAEKSQPKHDTSPLPQVRITLLKGRRGSGQTPMYLMADGTGSIATYIHLPAFKSKTPIYGVDSPFLRCPSRLTPETGIEGVAKYIVDALMKAEPTGAFYIGGFSAGSIVAYEVARQLPLAGRKVDGLLLIDLCCPRPATGVTLSEEEVNRETDTGITIFGNAAATDGLWHSTGTTREHLRAYLLAMRLYHPPAMTPEGRPGKAAIIWAEQGLVHRVSDDAESMRLLTEAGIPVKPYPGFMEDPKLGPFACFVPDKTKDDLGPNGWDKYVGDILTLSMDGDHLDMPMPKHAHLLHERLETVLTHFNS